MSTSTKIQKHDLDVTPEDLNAMSRNGLLKATLPASGWSSSTPYTQTITVNGMKDGDKPIIGGGEPSTLSADAYKVQEKNFGMINRAIVNADNQITFYCYVKKPTADIQVFIKV